MKAASTSQLSRRQWLRWIGTALSALLFVWLISRQDWGEVWKRLQQMPLWLLPLAFALYVAGLVANAVRWNILLRAPGIRLPLLDAIRIVFTGSFVSNFLPSTIGGDTVRFVGVMHFTADRAVGLASVILDRLVNLSAFLTILPFSALTFGASGIWQRLIPQTGMPVIAAAAARLLPERVRGWLAHGRQIFKVWLERPRILLLAFCVSWLSIFVIFLAIWLVGRGLGIPVALYQVMGVTAITYLLTLLPISVNGYGVREVAITTLYMPLGASLEQAATLALVTRFLSMLATLPGALWLSQVISGPAALEPPPTAVED
jgi:hypothetical protein